MRSILNSILTEGKFQKGQKFWVTGPNESRPEEVVVKSVSSDENGDFMEVRSATGRISTIYDSDLPKYQISFETY